MLNSISSLSTPAQCSSRSYKESTNLQEHERSNKYVHQDVNDSKIDYQFDNKDKEFNPNLNGSFHSRKGSNMVNPNTSILSEFSNKTRHINHLNESASRNKLSRNKNEIHKDLNFNYTSLNQNKINNESFFRKSNNSDLGPDRDKNEESTNYLNNINNSKFNNNQRLGLPPKSKPINKMNSSSSKERLPPMIQLENSQYNFDYSNSKELDRNYNIQNDSIISSKTSNKLIDVTSEKDKIYTRYSRTPEVNKKDQHKLNTTNYTDRSIRVRETSPNDRNKTYSRNNNELEKQIGELHFVVSDLQKKNAILQKEISSAMKESMSKEKFQDVFNNTNLHEEKFYSQNMSPYFQNKNYDQLDSLLSSGNKDSNTYNTKNNNHINLLTFDKEYKSFEEDSDKGYISRENILRSNSRKNNKYNKTYNYEEIVNELISIIPVK
jgi:hypothetical protein